MTPVSESEEEIIFPSEIASDISDSDTNSVFTSHRRARAANAKV